MIDDKAGVLADAQDLADLLNRLTRNHGDDLHLYADDPCCTWAEARFKYNIWVVKDYPNDWIVEERS